MKTYTTD